MRGSHFFCSLVSFDSLAVVACGWCRLWPAVRLFGRATRLIFGGACAGCGAAVRALRFLSGRPLRTPSCVAFSFAGRSQYNNLWSHVAIKTQSVISIHTYRCRQSGLYRHSLSDRRRLATLDFAHSEWAKNASTRNDVLCL